MEGKGGEFRRVHIIYFLSRTGRIEQPRLIRITHLHTNGLYLRDVKKWLSGLRGKTMPDSFSWSYKRRYGKGYVWQDLRDDDLITPISDNEFVLKGSEIVPSSHDDCLYDERKGYSMKEQEQETALSGSERSSVTDESIEEEEENINSETSCSSSILMKKTNDDTSSSSSNNNNNKGDDIRIGGSKRRLFRNLLRCGASDTNDSVLVMRSNKNQLNNHQICKAEKLGGSSHQQNTRRSHDGAKKQSQRQSSGHKKPACASYRPVRGPTCSQCGKTFKPEKLHKHMKSCRGLRAMPRNAAHKHTNKSANTQSSYTHLLTN